MLEKMCVNWLNGDKDSSVLYNSEWQLDLQYHSQQHHYNITETTMWQTHGTEAWQLREGREMKEQDE